MKNGHVVFTSVNRAYLNRALTLARSVQLNDPNVHFVVLLVEPNLSADFQSDQVFTELLTENAFDEVLTLNDLDTSTIANFENYSVIEMCTAVKGVASQFLLNREDAKIVTYLDPDLYFFTSLEAIRKEHENSDVLLTPHLNHSPTSNLVIHNDEIAGSMKHGIFNLGFVSFKSSKRSKIIAAWWADRLAISSSADYSRGLFTDQKWWDLSLVYFPDIRVVKNDGWNMAPWNLSERKLISLKPPILVSGDPLVFFHFSKFPGNDFFEKTNNYSKPALLVEIISEYRTRFDQASLDVSHLIVNIEKYLAPSHKIAISASFGQRMRKGLIRRLNQLLGRRPAIYSFMVKHLFIQRTAKWLYQKLVSFETKENLEGFDFQSIKKAIGERPLQILLTHRGGGGVEEVVKYRFRQLSASRMAPGILRPIDEGSYQFNVAGQTFKITSEKELQDLLALSEQIEIHHIFGFENHLDMLANASIAAVYLHDRYFISQTPFADSLRYGKLKYEIAGVNAPLNSNFAMDPVAWSDRNHRILKRAKKLYSPSSFLAGQFQEIFADLTIERVTQEAPIGPVRTNKISDLGALQIILISPTNFHKGSEVLLRVARLLEKDAAAISFVVIGDLDFRVRNELAQLSNVQLFPQMTRDRLKLKLSEIKNGVGWIPSITAESYSLALSDFLSSGFLVISSDLGAVSERLRQSPDHLIYNPASNVDDLAGDFLKIVKMKEKFDGFRVLKRTTID